MSQKVDSVSTVVEKGNVLRDVRLKKLQQLRELQIDPYPARFKRSHTAEQIHSQFEHLTAGEETTIVAQVAGRIMSIRNSGMFIDLQDASGKIQIFCHKNHLSEEHLNLLKLLDIGDFIGVHGLVRRTPRGELTINANQLEILTKTLLPLPEKYHGLTDVETRYRQRYLDLIMSEESRDTLRKRCQIVSEMRSYLLQHGFLEVETPMLQAIAGGAIARPFITHHNTLDMDLYLRIAPELFLKRLVVGGLSEKVFELNRCFRNEGISTRHNPEFTTVEIYQAYADYQTEIELTEALVAHLAQTVLGTLKVKYGEHEIDFTPPWSRKSMIQLVKEATGVDFLTFQTAQEAQKASSSLGVSGSAEDSWGKVIENVFAEKVEHTLIQPTHVTELPRDISPLAKGHPQDSRLTERFETYVNTWEIANGFSEINDPLDQRARFESQVAQREAGDSEAHQMDEDFLTALEYGMPPTGGLGIGIDRLAMILTNSLSIRDVIAFPTLRDKS